MLMPFAFSPPPRHLAETEKKNKKYKNAAEVRTGDRRTMDLCLVLFVLEKGQACGEVQQTTRKRPPRSPARFAQRGDDAPPVFVRQ